MVGFQPGAVLFVAGVLQPHIDPVCSGSPWDALSWIFLVLACGGLIVAATATVVVARQRRVGALTLWTLALVISMIQVVLAVMAAHMVVGACEVGVKMLDIAVFAPFLRLVR